jgi:hypothetical protein
VPHLPRFRALALFGRRPSVRGDSFVIPASENLHTSGPIRQVCPQILSTLLHPQSRSTAPQRYLAIAAL